MKRRTRSYIGAFSYGLVLASVPVAAFWGADYLFAPPTPDAATIAAEGAARSGQHPLTTAAIPGSEQSVAAAIRHALVPAAKTRADQPIRVSAPAPASDANATLISAIQQELRRVGCYAGDTTGAWNDDTRQAMEAFNATVRVNLPTVRPDYILLTLVQGHSAKACARSCSSARPGACIDPSLEASAKPASPATMAATPRSAATTANAPTSWSTTTAAGPVVVVPENGDVRVIEPAAQPRIVSVPGVAPRPVVSMASVDGSDTAPETGAPLHLRTGDTLPGRMSVGVPVTAEPVVVHTPPNPPAPVVAAPVRRAPVVPVSAKARGQRMFSDIGQNAP